MSIINDVVARLMRTTSPDGGDWEAQGGVGTAQGPGSGAGGAWPHLEPWRSTSVQVCGLYPLLVGDAAPLVGVPLGRVLGGAGVVCADPISWFEEGLISAPSAMVLGNNGLGKSSLVRRIVAGQAAFGTHSMVLGDIKPDYVKLVRALGGQVIEIGDKERGINPLDAGNVEEAVALLADHPRIRDRLLTAAHDRKKALVLSLIQIVRRQQPTDREEVIVDEAISVLEARGGRPALGDLVEVIRQGPESVRAAALDRGDVGRYRELTEALEVSLTALLRGRLGAYFQARRTEPMMMDRCVAFDVSRTSGAEQDVQAAVLLACWSTGFGSVEVAQALADAGVAPRRRYCLVMDELWRILRASSGMVERVDSLTRLNRTIGIGQVMITHSMADFAALASEEDRLKAQGFVERSKMLFLGGLPDKEMLLLRQVMGFSNTEADMLAGWCAPGTFDKTTKTTTDPAGMGNFYLKTSSAAGTPFHVDFVADEAVTSDTNERWDVKRGSKDDA